MDDTPALWNAYRTTRDTSVKMQLAMHYSGIARHVARQLRHYAVAALEEDDLVQIGIIGIGEAIAHFDQSRGTKFETYAMLRARWHILDEVRRLDWIPRYTREHYTKKRCSGSAAESVELMQYEHLYEIVSLNTPLKDKQGAIHSTIGESLPSTDRDALAAMMENELRSEMLNVIRSLPPSQCKVLMMRYYDNIEMKEIAAIMGVSAARVSQLHRSAIEVLKKRLRST